jgi:hypothetical protein
MVAENNLLSVRDTVNKNKEKISVEYESISSDLQHKARLCRDGTREQRSVKLKKLIPLMHKLKRCRNQILIADKHTRLLEVQLNAFENGRFQKEMTNTLRASVYAMKKVGITEDIRLVDDMMVDVEESYTQQQDVADSMESSLINSMGDSSQSDESIMRELLAMMGGDDDIAEEHIAATDTLSESQLKPPIVSTIPNTVSQQQQQRQLREQIKLQEHNRPYPLEEELAGGMTGELASALA